MRPTSYWALSSLAVLLSLAGCSHAPHQPEFGAELPVTPVEALPQAARGSVEEHIRGLASLPASQDAVPGQSRTTLPYRGLTAWQCQCYAVSSSSLARQEDQEQQAAGRNRRISLRSRRTRRQAELRRAILAGSALESQNRSAGAALELYYRLAEAEARADLLAQTQERVREALQKIRDLVKQDLKSPVDPDLFLRQGLSLQADEVQLQLGIRQLNSELRRLLGLPPYRDDWRIWPMDDLVVSSEPLDVEAEVRRGLAVRPELMLLRLLIQELDAETLPVIRMMVQVINPLLGTEPQARPIGMLRLVTVLMPFASSARAEISTRRWQLQLQLRERELAVADEIRQAAATMAAHAQLAALARDRARSWQEKSKDVSARKEQGLASFVEVTTTNLEWLRARGDIVQEIVAWNLARVKLRQAQGMLAQECARGQAETCISPVDAGPTTPDATAAESTPSTTGS